MEQLKRLVVELTPMDSELLDRIVEKRIFNTKSDAIRHFIRTFNGE